jgi:isochorismate synthase
LKENNTIAFGNYNKACSQLMIAEAITLDILQIWQKAINAGLPIALWRLPNETDKQLAIDLSGNTQPLQIDFDELPAGFVISPFLNEDFCQSEFLKADVYMQFNPSSELDVDASWGIKVWQDLTLQTPPQSNPHTTTIPTATTDANNYISLVKTGIEQIKQGCFQKVVLSRTKETKLPIDFDTVEAFHKLCKAYPTAFVSLIYLPKEQSVWLGATPEILVSSNEKGIFRTISLAGTQAAIDHTTGETISPAEARWSQKEIEEQALVSRYIVECFKRIRLREFIENGPKTVQAGNLLHLRTDYVVDTQMVNFPQLATIMLKLLHPTSAVCGMPKTNALAFILEHEEYNRQYYSGYLGPINIKESTHLFVNLRTMQICQNHAIFYAGAGITEDSTPEKEWAETEIKCQTLMRVVL